ncbi:MAG: hypothetical protein P1U34_07595 [Coxiellaceae bacterium]|nr:hypothetical protein [Coxiellaceae bacterium]
MRPHNLLTKKTRVIAKLQAATADASNNARLLTIIEGELLNESNNARSIDALKRRKQQLTQKQDQLTETINVLTIDITRINSEIIEHTAELVMDNLASLKTKAALIEESGASISPKTSELLTQYITQIREPRYMELNGRDCSDPKRLEMLDSLLETGKKLSKRLDAELLPLPQINTSPSL